MYYYRLGTKQNKKKTFTQYSGYPSPLLPLSGRTTNRRIFFWLPQGKSWSRWQNHIRSSLPQPVFRILTWATLTLLLMECFFICTAKTRNFQGCLRVWCRVKPALRYPCRDRNLALFYHATPLPQLFCCFHLKGGLIQPPPLYRLG